MFGIFYSQLFVDTDLIDNRLEVKDCTVSISSVIDETFTMKSKIKYVDKYIFPEISNIYCLGKIQNIIYDEIKLKFLFLEVQGYILLLSYMFR